MRKGTIDTLNENVQKYVAVFRKNTKRGHKRKENVATLNQLTRCNHQVFLAMGESFHFQHSYLGNKS